MAKKKKDENEETVAEGAETAVEETAVEAAADDTTPVEDVAVEAAGVDTAAENAALEATSEETVEAAAEEASPVEEPAAEEVAVETKPIEDKPKKAPKAAAPKAAKPAKAAKKPVEDAPSDSKKISKRAEKIGIVASDRMMKTVTVRVDRLVKHPVYRKYVKKRKKFMAHDDMGAKIGDKVKIVETRPLSARKRWRVVEIIHRAES
jgi:small subunit ribosomal protein S17